MTDIRHDVLGIGNAIFDILSHVDEAFLAEQGFPKGSMNLVDADRSAAVYDRLGSAIRVSGGSAGNTIAGVASLGGAPAFIGKVADDAFGEAYRHDMRALGATFDTAPLLGGKPTATSLILVTPDGERTMLTHLGACTELGPDDIDADLVRAARITFMEGYLFDPPQAKEAFRTAAAIAQEAGRDVALSLSDTFCVDRNREDFLELIRSKAIDVLFANEHELKALYQTASLELAFDLVERDLPMTVVTLGRRGATVIAGGERATVPAVEVEKRIDATGAGDLFAGGFLFGRARGLPPAVCTEIGCIAAAEVITHLGARPQTDLADLVAQSGLYGHPAARAAAG